MTRENKVALVVGFALVLFVGILISDHFSRARSRPADLIPTGTEQAQRPADLLDVRREPPPAAPTAPALPAASTAAPVAAAPQPSGAQPPQTLPVLPGFTVIPSAPAGPATADATATADARLHEVRPGESLSSICQHYYGDQRYIEKLAAYNGLDDPDSIWGGARLRVPPLNVLAPGSAPAVHAPAAPAGAAAPAPAPGGAKRASYQVQEGDTLCSIAQRLLHTRSRWKQLYEINREVISDPDNIRPGAVIRIPAG